MLIIGAEDQNKVITMKEAIVAVATALSNYSAGQAISPIRMAIPVSKVGGTSLFMPSLVESADSLGVKFVSVFPKNKEKGKKTIYGVMVLVDVETAEPLALLEASNLTVLRTGAASGLATKYMSREDSKVLSVIGTGAQARGLIKGVQAVRQIEEIRLFNRTPAKAYDLANEMKEEYDGEDCPNIIVMLDTDSALDGADIVITATNSEKPVFSSHYIHSGVHVNAVGSFRPTMQEIPTDLVTKASKVVVESRETALEETGDLIFPIKQGVFSAEQIYAELGEMVNGVKRGRENNLELTIFKSVGLAAMDVVVAKLLYDNARKLGIGQTVRL